MRVGDGGGLQPVQYSAADSTHSPHCPSGDYQAHRRRDVPGTPSPENRDTGMAGRMRLGKAADSAGCSAGGALPISVTPPAVTAT